MDDDNLKGKVLGNLAGVSALNESIYYLLKRIDIIAGECSLGENHLGTIRCLDEKMSTFSFDQLNDLGFVCFSLNNYFTQLGLTKEKFHLNQLRLKINTKLNHSRGVFVSSLELISEPINQDEVELYSFSEDLFYQFPESTFRVQMFPFWLRNTLNSENTNLIAELSISAEVMLNDTRKQDFVSKETIEQFRIKLPTNAIEDCLAHKSIKAGEAEVLKIISELGN